MFNRTFSFQLQQAKQVFLQHARGPACEKYLKELEESCERVWKDGRQLCEEVSITGNHCVHEVRSTPTCHQETCTLAQHVFCLLLAASLA